MQEKTKEQAKMGFRGTIIFIAAIITIIVAVFEGDSASFMQGVGVVFIFFLIFAVTRLINK